MVGHLNSFSASGGGNLNNNFAKNSNARGLPGGEMSKLRFDWYITAKKCQTLDEYSEKTVRGAMECDVLKNNYNYSRIR